MVHEDAGLFSVLRASAPATLNQLAAPIATALQLAMFGRFLPTESVAAWIAIGATVQFVANLANFLLVVSVARVSHALGAEDWAALGSTVRYALVAACAVGVAAAAMLLLLRSRVLQLMGLPDATAAAYYVLAVGRLPFLMLLRTASGVVVGYQRLGVAATVNAGLAGIETVAVFAVLAWLQCGLLAAAWASLLAAACASGAALLAVFRLPPEPSVRLCCCGGGSKGVSGQGGGGSKAGGGDGGGKGGGAPDARPAAAKSACSLLRDATNVFLRSVLLNGSMWSLSVAAAQLSPAALVAHGVVLQLWMLASYAADGLADVGTMRGARFLGAGDKASMAALVRTLSALGLLLGTCIALLLLCAQHVLESFFTSDPEARLLLRTVWPLLCALQPVNATVWVYDGLLYATASFAFVRNALALGVCCLFAPALYLLHPYGLAGLWTAKALLNGFRCAAALLRIHLQLGYSLYPCWSCDDLPELRAKGAGPSTMV